MLHVARWKCRTQKLAKNHHLGIIAQLCRAIYSQLRHVSIIGKNLLSSNISSTCPHNMVNFGPLAAEIDPVVCGTPANFTGFHVLAVLLHGTPVLGVSQTAALNKGRHLYYSAGRPSRWALAHIIVFHFWHKPDFGRSPHNNIYVAKSIFFQIFAGKNFLPDFFRAKPILSAKSIFVTPFFWTEKTFFPPASKNLPTLAFGSVHDVWCKNLGEKRQV